MSWHWMCGVCEPLGLQKTTGKKSQAAAIVSPTPLRYRISARFAIHVNLLQAGWQSVDR